MKLSAYAGGFVDALALVSVTLLILIAAIFAGGCAHRQPPPPPPPSTSTGCIYTVLGIRIVELEDNPNTSKESTTP